MALPVTIPNAFASATASIPLSQLDANFNTLANAVNGISDGSETLANVTATVGNITTVNATTVDTTNIEVTNIKAKDGTAAVVLTDSTGAVAVSTPLTANGGVVFNEAGADVDFRVEGDTDANLLFVDASTDRVGVGTNSPAGKLDVNGRVNIADAFELTWGGTSASIYGSSTNNQLRMYTANTERARITSGGYFKASSTGSYNDAAGVYHELRTSFTDSNTLLIDHTSASSPYGVAVRFPSATPDNTTNTFLRCEDSTNNKCLIFSSGTISNRTGTYNAISDLKLKQDIVDASSQWDDIKALRVVKYRLKDEVAADPNYPAYIGLVAQEVEQVSAGLVDDCPDFENVEVPVLDDEGNPVLDEEGNPQVTTERQATGTVTKSVKYSILYMKAVKALQEAMERIETLEAKVAALENV